MNLFKNKIVLVAVFLSVLFSLSLAPPAHAGFIFSIFVSIMEVVVDIVEAVVCAVVDIFGTCYSNGGGAGTSSGSTCVFQMPLTFYNPRMIDEDSSREVKIYRFSLLANSTPEQITNWFVDNIKASVGSGWIGMPIIQQVTSDCGYSANPYSTESYLSFIEDAGALLTTQNYSDICEDNVCSYTDNIETDSVPSAGLYVAYAAKIIGNYTRDILLDIYYNDGGATLTLPNKFFNKNNYLGDRGWEFDEILNEEDEPQCYFWYPYVNPDVVFPGETTDDYSVDDLGNAIIGPFRIDTQECPTCSITLGVWPPGAGSAAITAGSSYFLCNGGEFSEATATANAGYVLGGWDINGDGAVDVGASNNPYSINHSSDSVITAIFTSNNQPPSANGLNVNVVSGPAATFNWTFWDPDAGDTQSAYQVQVFSGSGIVVDSGQISSASGSYYTGQGKLSYNTTYYWQLKVWDSQGADSGWINAASFATPSHEAPDIGDIFWTPANPSVNEEVTFGATVHCHQTGGAQIACPVGNFSWIFANGIPSVVIGQLAPQVEFSTCPSQVTLSVTDSDGYSAQRQELVFCGLPLPIWKEVAPWDN